MNTYTYDKAGNQVTSTDPDNDTTTTTYDALDRQSTVKTPDGGVTTYVYDNDGRLYVLVDPVGNRTTFLYDSLGRQTTQISPSVNSGSGVTSTTQYDADGEVTQTTDANGRVITYSYDSRGDQTGESWLSSGSAIYIATYTYDAAKEMTGAADNNSLLTIAYDNDGRVGTIATSGSGTGPADGDPDLRLRPVGRRDKHQGQPQRQRLPGPGDHDLRLRPCAAADDDHAVVRRHGRPAGGQHLRPGRPAHRAGPATVGGGSTVGQHDLRLRRRQRHDRRSTISARASRRTSRSRHEISESFDPAAPGRHADGHRREQQHVDTYSYDASGQVTGSTGGSNDSYSYDLNGNPNATGYTTGAGNELTNSPGVTYTYDNDGNIITATTTSGTTTYTYDYENRLTSVDQHGTVIATYIYDALGRRIEIEDSGTQTWTVYNGTSADANPYADFTSSGAVSDALPVRPGGGRDPGPDELQRHDGVVPDRPARLGAVHRRTRRGTILDEIIYDAFGNITNQTGSSYADRFMFAGMQYDATTGLYYDHARYYDAAIGRFVSQDPKGFAAGDTNLYRYVSNEPLTSVDTTGETDDEGIMVIVNVRL